MDYEKKYKYAMEAMREWIAPCHTQEQLDNLKRTIFPELRESEDERVRKGLITFFQGFPYSAIEKAGTNPKEAIAWLEKQGEQKQTGEDMKEALRTEYEKGRADAFAQMQKKFDDSRRRQDMMSFLESLRLGGKIEL